MKTLSRREAIASAFVFAGSIGTSWSFKPGDVAAPVDGTCRGWRMTVEKVIDNPYDKSVGQRIIALVCFDPEGNLYRARYLACHLMLA